MKYAAEMALCWHDIHTKFLDDRSRLSSNIRDNATTAKLALLMESIYEVSRLDLLRWYDAHTTFLNYRFRNSSNIKVIIEKFEKLKY
jgi:hypothetical protein